MSSPDARGTVRALAALLVSCAVIPAAGCGPTVSEQSARLSDSMLALGREALEQGDPGDALRKGLQALEHDPTNADATYFVGFVYAARGDYADAERYLRKTIDLDSTYTDARNTLGQVLNNQGRYAEAIVVLEEAARDVLYPTPHLVEANLGQAYTETGDLDQAVEWLLRSVRNEPRFCLGYFRLGVALARKGDDATAVEALTRAVSIEDPACQRFQPAWRLLGEVRLGLGRLEAAGEAFTECRRIGETTEDGRACAAAADRIGSGTDDGDGT